MTPREETAERAIRESVWSRASGGDPRQDVPAVELADIMLRTVSATDASKKILERYELRRRPQRTGSYPFLDVARDHGVSYRTVLHLADLYSSEDWTPSNPLDRDIVRACRAEALRREEMRRAQ